MLAALLLRMRRRRGGYRAFVQTRGGVGRLALYLALIFVAHVLAMMALEDMAPFDAAWLTATTMVTVGYGDFFAKSVEGRIATMLLLYAGGIFVLAKAVNDGIEARAEMAERKARGAWRWKMRDHILIVGTPDRLPTPFFERLVKTIRDTPELAERPVQILTSAYAEATLPRSLADLGVVHWNGGPADAGALEAAGAGEAFGIMVLARSVTDATCDAETFDTVDRLRLLPVKAPIVAECIDDANRARLRRVGARNLVRPLPAYPGMLVRALVAPGSEEIIEELFTASGDECYRVDLDPAWQGDWSVAAAGLITAGIGTPLAFEDTAGRVHVNPMGRRGIEARALFLVMPHTDGDTVGRVRAALK